MGRRGGALKGIEVIVVIAVGITTLILSIVSFTQIQKNADNAADIFNNWKTGAVLDITVAPKCPQGFEEAINSTWPGITAGCDCRNISFFMSATFEVRYDTYQYGCRWKHRAAGCIDVPAAPPVLVDTWGQVNNKKSKICILRSRDTWLSVGPKSGAACRDSRMKKCGSKPENVFCTYENKCPINAIDIISINPRLNAAALTSCTPNNNCLLLSKNDDEAKLLKYKRSDVNNGLPLVQMRFNEYAMCKTFDQDNITPNRKEFPWIKSQRTTCGNEGSSLWKKEDTMTEEDLFNLNGLGLTIENLKPFWYYVPPNSGKDYTWGLFSRRYVPWKLECRSEMEAIAERSDNVKSLKSLQLGQLIVNSVVTIILALFVPCFIFQGGKAASKIISLAVLLLLLVFQSLSASSASSASRYFSGSNIQGCSDAATMEILSSTESGTGSAYSNDIKGLVFSIIAIVFQIITLFFKR